MIHTRPKTTARNKRYATSSVKKSAYNPVVTGVRTKYGLGGTLGTLTGAAIGSIVPGVGTAIGASIGGSLGGGIDSLSAGKKASRLSRQQQALLDAQYRMDTQQAGSLGNFAYGGFSGVPGNEDAVAFEGPSHAQGGIMLNPQAEVEGGETMDKVDGQQFIFSKRIAVPGKKTSFADEHKNIKKKGGGKLEVKTLARMQENEKEKLGIDMRKRGYTKMQYGGSIPPYESRNVFTNAPFKRNYLGYAEADSTYVKPVTLTDQDMAAFPSARTMKPDPLSVLPSSSLDYFNPVNPFNPASSFNLVNPFDLAPTYQYSPADLSRANMPGAVESPTPVNTPVNTPVTIPVNTTPVTTPVRRSVTPLTPQEKATFRNEVFGTDPFAGQIYDPTGIASTKKRTVTTPVTSIDRVNSVPAVSASSASSRLGSKESIQQTIKEAQDASPKVKKKTGKLAGQLLQFAPEIASAAIAAFAPDSTPPPVKAKRAVVKGDPTGYNINPLLTSNAASYRSILSNRGLANRGLGANAMLMAQGQKHQADATAYATKANMDMQNRLSRDTTQAGIDSSINAANANFNSQYREDKMMVQGNRVNTVLQSLAGISNKKLQMMSEQKKMEMYERLMKDMKEYYGS